MTSKSHKPESADDAQIMDAIRGSMQQIWQAGLGAFLRAQKEGNAIFQDLVQEGEKLQARTRDLAGDRLSGLSEAVTKMAENASKQASGSWEKLEGVFEDRVSRSLRTMGVPTRSDIAALGAQIESLQKSVDVLASKGKAKAPAKKAAASKTAAKAAGKTAAKKGAASKTARARGTTRRAAGSSARAM